MDELRVLKDFLEKRIESNRQLREGAFLVAGNHCYSEGTRNSYEVLAHELWAKVWEDRAILDKVNVMIGEILEA